MLPQDPAVAHLRSTQVRAAGNGQGHVHELAGGRGRADQPGNLKLDSCQ